VLGKERSSVFNACVDASHVPADSAVTDGRLFVMHRDRPDAGDRLDAASPGQKLSQHRILVHAHPSNGDILPDHQAIIVSAYFDFEHCYDGGALLDLVRETKTRDNRCKRWKDGCRVDLIRAGGRKRGRNADRIAYFSGI
jgi:hypothetical protein